MDAPQRQRVHAAEHITEGLGLHSFGNQPFYAHAGCFNVGLDSLRERVDNDSGNCGNRGGGGDDKIRTAIATEINGEREWNEVLFKPVLTPRKSSVETY